MTTPIVIYKHHVETGLIQADSQQQEVITRLESIYQALLRRADTHTRWFDRILRRLKHRSTPPVQGLYLWGSVGVGKTFLMDLFYNCLPVPKARLHFHAFMESVQQQLKEHQGTEDPLTCIARAFAEKTRVLCFDELFVDDIADAMILSGLFKGLFEHGVTLIASSNTPPENLYFEGLQRERFLPAIALIQEHTETFHMISHHDYREDHSYKAQAYFTPLHQETERQLLQVFNYLRQNTTEETGDFILYDRKIPTIKRTQKIIWFDFKIICGIPRSQIDYLAIAQLFDTVFISNIPQIKPREKNWARALINLVDVFYDQHVRIVISAETDIEHIYTQGDLSFEFARTQSRLIEMQSTDYFSTTRK